MEVTAQTHEEHQTSTGLPNTKVAMWAFLGSECLFFGAMISTYLLYRNQAPGGTVKPADVFDIPYTSVSSFVLLMSSLTMVLALASFQRGDEQRGRGWLLATALLGAVFVGGQIFEFTDFYHEGVRLQTNAASTAFFVLTGFHGAHVTGGILMLLSLVSMSKLGKLPPSDSLKVENVGLYWHFVDVVWIVIFTVVYLMP
jgi:cytochrome c oxidase subunit 3/cytochrome o ubiquinol oxidase subunit 3